MPGGHLICLIVTEISTRHVQNDRGPVAYVLLTFCESVRCSPWRTANRLPTLTLDSFFIGVFDIDTSAEIMRFSSLAFLSLATSNSVAAFAPHPRAFVSPRTMSSSLNSNVLKLSDPEKELLDQVDVFIFDCDGVIWRVGWLILEVDSGGVSSSLSLTHPLSLAVCY